MHNRSSCRWTGAALAACALLLCTSLGAASDRTGSHGNGWKTYRNDRYAFRVSYPADGRIETQRRGHVQSVRILNYDDAAERQGSLSPGEYSIEVFIYDHRLGHRMDGKCHDVLREADKVKIGRIAGWRGTTAQADDIGVTPQAVCVESTKVDVLVTAAEGDPVGPLVSRVLDTVRFGN